MLLYMIIYMESDVRIKEQRNIPLLQSGENIESLRNTGCGDSYGMPHPQGTCVLSEVNTLNELINYFQGLYQNPSVI